MKTPSGVMGRGGNRSTSIFSIQQSKAGGTTQQPVSEQYGSSANFGIVPMLWGTGLFDGGSFRKQIGRTTCPNLERKNGGVRRFVRPSTIPASPNSESSNKRRFDSLISGIRWTRNQGLGRCPFHNDHRPSLSFDAKRGLFFCHGCGAKGNLAQFERRMGRRDRKTGRKDADKPRHGRERPIQMSNIKEIYPYTDKKVTFFISR